MKISMKPKSSPLREASRVAQRRSPFQYHSAARNARPPSSGKAGIRLKTPMMILMKAK